MISLAKIKDEYLLHYFVWNNDYRELKDAIKEEKYDIEKLDPRGRTPLFLAVKLCHLECIKVLLQAKSNANFECDGWSVVQEAVCTGDPNILTAVLEVRDLQRHTTRVSHVPQLLQRLLDAPDFYCEMKWEFTSWVPLMSRLCPSDVYKVYKRGSNVRIDTTLLGFDNTTWQRGNRSYIFKGQTDSADMIEIDHETNEVSIEHMKSVEGEIDGITPTRESVNYRLTAPVVSNNIDMDRISFERNKSGFFGWRSEKTEMVNDYECKVYGASNVEFVTKTRSEHLNEDQNRIKNSRTPLQHLLGMADDDFNHANPNDQSAIRDKSPSSVSPDLNKLNVNDETQATSVPETSNATNVNVTAPTLEEYFTVDFDLNGRDVGRPKKISAKVQKFRANLWLSEEFPIKLQEQVLPILDLMSTMASPHVSKLKDFITMQLPSGFPVKIEIPLFHILNAVVTFGNVFGLENEIPHVSHIRENDRITCVIDDQCFEVPSYYTKKGSDYRRQMTYDDQDDLMQFAIQQSLLDNGGSGVAGENDEVDIWEALKVDRPLTPNYYEDAQLQRALQESLLASSASSRTNNPTTLSAENNLPINNQPFQDDIDSNLALAIKLSEDEARKFDEDRKKEQDMLDEIIRLSLEEK